MTKKLTKEAKEALALRTKRHYEIDSSPSGAPGGAFSIGKCSHSNSCQVHRNSASHSTNLVFVLKPPLPRTAIWLASLKALRSLWWFSAAQSISNFSNSYFCSRHWSPPPAHLLIWLISLFVGQGSKLTERGESPTTFSTKVKQPIVVRIWSLPSYHCWNFSIFLYT